MSVRSWYPQGRAILQVICDGFGDTARDSEILVIPVLIKSATVHVNSYKQADSYEIVFDASDLPFDPRLIRAGSAEIYIFQTTGLSDRHAVLSRGSPLADPDPGGVRPRDQLDTALLESGASVTRDKFTLGNKPRIVGLFDEDDLEMSESGKWVTISGQDYTAHLASIQWPPNPSGTARLIPVGKRLDDFVRDLLAVADPDGNLNVDVRGVKVSDLPVVGNSETRSTTRGIPVEQGTTYWDVIYKTVERYGLIAFVSGFDVVISRPKTISETNAASVKRLTWGKNLAHLSMKRHFGKEQVPTIVVRSYDPRTKQTISVEHPSGGTIDRSVTIDATKHAGLKSKVHGFVKQSTSTSKKGKVKTTLRERDEYQIVDVYGITDRAVLAKIAENRYHLLGKAERTVTVKTRDLAIPGDTPGRDLVDILGVEAGDAFFIEWDEFNREVLADPRLSEGAKAEYLIRRGFNSQIANTIARHYAILDGLDRPLRFKEGTITYDCDSGIEIEMVLQDFIVIDGVRPGDGAAREPRTNKNHAACVTHDGKQIGGDAAARIERSRTRHL